MAVGVALVGESPSSDEIASLAPRSQQAEAQGHGARQAADAACHARHPGVGGEHAWASWHGSSCAVAQRTEAHVAYDSSVAYLPGQGEGRVVACLMKVYGPSAALGAGPVGH